MSRVAEVEFHPQARAEFDAVFDWYRERSEQAAADFLSEVEEAIASIATKPMMLSQHRYGTRRYVLRHFPYLVVYLLDEARVEIVAIAHGRRRPGYWRERMTLR